MIVLDTSSIVAIFRQEPDASDYAACIAQAAGPVISAANVLETSIVLRRLKQIAAHEAELWLDDFLKRAGVEVVPVNLTQVAIARDAHGIYGKGDGHRAQLNYGDCFAYALAKSLDAPLLFKGADFSHTDVARAL